MSRALLLFALAAGAASEPTPRGDGVELWAGQVILLGERTVPLLGRISTRSESYVLAEVRRTAQGVVLRERPCGLRIAATAGAKMTVDQASLRDQPPNEVLFVRGGGGDRLHAPAWRTEARALPIRVEAPLCGGRLWVDSAATSIARGKLLAGGGLEGEIKSRVDQTIRGVEGACLSLVAKDSTEALRGTISYRRIEAGSSCDDALRIFDLPTTGAKS
jgi:hypothetical protein